MNTKTLLRIASFLLALLAGLSFTACKDSRSDFISTETTAAEFVAATEEELHSVVAKTEHYELSLAVYALMFENVASSNSSALSAYYGVDFSKKLREQEAEEGVSWFSYLMDQIVVPTVQEMVLSCEAAQKAGISLNEEELKIVEDAVKENVETLPPGAREEDLRLIMHMSSLAMKYQSELYNSFTYTEEDYEKYLSENYRTLADAVQYGYLLDLSEEDDVDAVLAKTEALKDAADDDTYFAVLAAVIGDVVTDETKTPEQAAKSTMAASTLPDTEAADWAYAEGRAVGDVFTKYNEEKKTVLIVRIKEVPSPDETETINVRHILALTESHETKEEARRLAEEWYEEWKSGNATENSFAVLAEKYTEDPGSSTNGGLYASVTPGQMVTEFNDWCFDPARKEGDTGIVDTSYGSHVMYFSGRGLPVWKNTADKALRDADYEKAFTEALGKETVTPDAALLAKLDY